MKFPSTVHFILWIFAHTVHTCARIHTHSLTHLYTFIHTHHLQMLGGYSEVDPDVLFTKQEKIGKGSFGEVFKGWVSQCDWVKEGVSKRERERERVTLSDLIGQAWWFGCDEPSVSVFTSCVSISTVTSQMTLINAVCMYSLVVC